MIGIFGGTFNPVHRGHLHCAVQIMERLPINSLSMMPCHIPPHRVFPSTSAHHRLEMLRLALTNLPQLEIDEQELNRDGPSYTVDSLRNYRSIYGVQPTCFIMGSDAFLTFDQWHQWKQILDFAHLIVVIRPGWQLKQLDNMSTQLRTVLNKNRTDQANDLTEQAFGCIYMIQIDALDVSSTLIRQKIAQGQSIREYVPAAVEHYIHEHKLYR